MWQPAVPKKRTILFYLKIKTDFELIGVQNLVNFFFQIWKKKLICSFFLHFSFSKLKQNKIKNQKTKKPKSKSKNWNFWQVSVWIENFFFKPVWFYHCYYYHIINIFVFVVEWKFSVHVPAKIKNNNNKAYVSIL